MQRLSQSQSMESMTNHMTTGHQLVNNAMFNKQQSLSHSASMMSMSQNSFAASASGSLKGTHSRNSSKKVSMQATHTVQMLDELNSLMEFSTSTGGTNPATSRVTSSSRRERRSKSRGTATGTATGGGNRGRLSPIEHQHHNHGSIQSPAHGHLTLGGSLDDDAHSYSKLQQAEAQQMQSYIEKLAQDGIYANMAFPNLSINGKLSLFLSMIIFVCYVFISLTLSLSISA
jgi:hypothetical protein